MLGLPNYMPGQEGWRSVEAAMATALRRLSEVTFRSLPPMASMIASSVGIRDMNLFTCEGSHTIGMTGNVRDASASVLGR